MANESHQLGAPDIKLAGVNVWVHQRQFPESEEFWDVNWLIVTASCSAPSAVVSVHGPIIHLTEIERLLNESQQVLASLSGKAGLRCMEPEFNLMLEMQTGGRLTLEVEITPDHLAQSHWFKFELDQSYLPGLIRDCQEVLEKYTLKFVPNR